MISSINPSLSITVNLNSTVPVLPQSEPGNIIFPSSSNRADPSKGLIGMSIWYKWLSFIILLLTYSKIHVGSDW